MKLSKLEQADPNITVGFIIKWSLITCFAVTVIWIGGAWIGVFGTAVTLPASIANKTLQPDNVIQNYEWFKQQYQDVKAIDRKIDNAKQSKRDLIDGLSSDRSSWSFDQNQEFARLGSIVLGLENQRASMVAEYNARTQMANRDLFRTSDLPVVIDNPE